MRYYTATTDDRQHFISLINDYMKAGYYIVEMNDNTASLQNDGDASNILLIYQK